MIAHRTFSRHGGVTPRGMLEAQQEAREQAEAFISTELNDSDIVSISESALPSTWGRNLVSVTVWYREK